MFRPIRTYSMSASTIVHLVSFVLVFQTGIIGGAFAEGPAPTKERRTSGFGNRAEREAELKAILQEPLAETIHYMRTSRRSSFIISAQSDFNSEGAAASLMRALPRARKLIDIARDGTEEERAQLRTALENACRDYVHVLPQNSPEGSFSPSVHYPGGAIAFPVVLAELDRGGEYLPLIVQMDDRIRGVPRASLAAIFPVEEVKERRVFTEVDAYLSLAAYRIFERMAESRGPITETNPAVSEFSLWNEQTAERGFYRREPLRMAREFVATSGGNIPGLP